MDRIDELLESLEVRFLGNRDEHLHFGLLTDLCDAAQESLVADEPLLRRARNGIEQLNQRYPSRGPIDSSCSIAHAAGIHRNASGWATSASAASSQI